MRAAPRPDPASKLKRTMPRRMRWTRTRAPRRTAIPRIHRQEGRVIARPSAAVSLSHMLATVGVVVVIWGVVTIFNLLFSGRIYPHVAINGVPVGGLTRTEALTHLQDTQAARLNDPLTVEVGARTFPVLPASLNARYDLASSVDAAFATARSGSFLFGAWNVLSTLVTGADVPLHGTVDQGAVAHYLATLATQTHVNPRSAVVGVDGVNAVIVQESRPGAQVALAPAQAALSRAVSMHDTTPLALPLQRINSALGHDQAQAVVDQAQMLLSAPIQFRWTVSSPRSWTLSPLNTGRLLTFKPVCRTGSCRFVLSVDAAKLNHAFRQGGVSQSFQRQPSPASFLIYINQDGSAGLRISPDQTGTIIDGTAAAVEIAKQSEPGAGRVIYLQSLPIKASFDTAAATALDLSVNVGRAVLGAASRTEAQRHNAAVAAASIANQTLLVTPGQPFSLDQIVGPLDATRAYSTGLNVVGKENVTGVNGGVEVLASGLLAAAFDAGLPIVERVPYPYLTTGMAPGFDAKIGYSPTLGQKKDRTPNLVFRNTTGHTILVTTYTDQNSGKTGVYLFNAAGYAPAHRKVNGAYTVTGDTAPTIAINPDGSVDVTRSRTVAVGSTTTSDTLHSHYTTLDP